MLEYRFADGREQQLPHLASELVNAKVDVIAAATSAAMLAAKRATSNIPIVMSGAGDPVEVGLVSSLARPGGNVTGVSYLLPDLEQKRLQILKETVPAAARIAHLGIPAAPDIPPDAPRGGVGSPRAGHHAGDALSAPAE